MCAVNEISHIPQQYYNLTAIILTFQNSCHVLCSLHYILGFSSLPCRRCRAVSPAETLLEVQPLLWGIYAHAFNITTRIGLPRNFCFLSLGPVTIDPTIDSIARTQRPFNYHCARIAILVTVCPHIATTLTFLVQREFVL